jgi:hypothetical protein
VQSILSGAIDPKEAQRLLGDELAPFVDGETLSLALSDAAKSSKTPDELQVELCDAFVIHAVDPLARALCAVALGCPSDIPASCISLRPLLDKHAPAAKKLIEA